MKIVELKQGGRFRSEEAFNKACRRYLKTSYNKTNASYSHDALQMIVVWVKRIATAQYQINRKEDEEEHYQLDKEAFYLNTKKEHHGTQLPRNLESLRTVQWELDESVASRLRKGKGRRSSSSSRAVEAVGFDKLWRYVDDMMQNDPGVLEWDIDYLTRVVSKNSFSCAKLLKYLDAHEAPPPPLPPSSPTEAAPQPSSLTLAASSPTVSRALSLPASLNALSPIGRYNYAKEIWFRLTPQQQEYVRSLLPPGLPVQQLFSPNSNAQHQIEFINRMSAVLSAPHQYPIGFVGVGVPLGSPPYIRSPLASNVGLFSPITSQARIDKGLEDIAFVRSELQKMRTESADGDKKTQSLLEKGFEESKARDENLAAAADFNYDTIVSQGADINMNLEQLVRESEVKTASGIYKVESLISEGQKDVSSDISHIQSDVSSIKSGQNRVASDVSDLQLGQKNISKKVTNVSLDVGVLQSGQKQLLSNVSKVASQASDLQSGQKQLKSKVLNVASHVSKLQSGQKKLTSKVSNAGSHVSNLQLGQNISTKVSNVTSNVTNLSLSVSSGVESQQGKLGKPVASIMKTQDEQRTQLVPGNTSLSFKQRSEYELDPEPSKKKQRVDSPGTFVFGTAAAPQFNIGKLPPMSKKNLRKNIVRKYSRK